MNCLQCENFWKSNIDESKCDKCGCEQKETEEAKNNGEKAGLC